VSRVLALLCALPLLVAPAQQPRFRAATDVVRLDVLAERNGRPLAGLTAADFVVRDNGIVQRVSLVSDTVPVSIAVVLDVSGSISAEQIAEAARATDGLRNGLRPGDRVTPYAFAADVRAVPVDRAIDTPASLQALASDLRRAAGGRTAFLDAVQMALLNGAATDESRLLLALTDGRDNTSGIDARTVVETALRRGVSLCFVALPSNEPRKPTDDPPVVGDVGLRLLRLLADRTGGRVVSLERSKPVGPVFEAILREYRQRYILSFEPAGVSKGDGWHRLTVALKGRGGRIHVRDGYWSR
jgi:VWFA-related protein